MSTSNTDKPPICVRNLPSGRRVVRPAVGAKPAFLEVAPSGRESQASGGTAGTLPHWAFLGLAVAVLLGSVLLEVRNHEQVVVPGVNVVLPGTCTFRKITGMPCPGCGLTRSFISMCHGWIREAWHYNAGGFFFFVVVVFQVPYRIYQIARIHRGREAHSFARVDSWILILLVIVLLVQWIFKLGFGGL